ncbi:hypothetical protein QQ045_024112 [Rhodiola kirilowii]
MPTFRDGDQPTGVYEKFNYRHSSLRTTIERAFGILKNSWKILKVMPQVSDGRQNDIITATFTLHNLIHMQKFSIPILARKYYLVGSGFPNTTGYLISYKDKRVRYHMPTFRDGDQPTEVYEKFNYRHSSLRTTIEIAFDILKNSWKILKVMPQVSDGRQNDIITSTFTLHNLTNETVLGRANSNLYDKQRKEQMNQVRDMIAFQIIEDCPDDVVEMNMDEDDDM